MTCDTALFTFDMQGFMTLLYVVRLFFHYILFIKGFDEHRVSRVVQMSPSQTMLSSSSWGFLRNWPEEMHKPYSQFLVYPVKPLQF